MQNVFTTGGTGYMGRQLIGQLLARGHKVRALVRKGSEAKVPAGAEAVIGDALEPQATPIASRPAIRWCNW